MEWLLAIAAAGGAGVYGVRRLIAARDDRRQRAVELEQVRKLADEDVTVFGDQLRRLGDTVGERTLDEVTHTDYQTALDAYERAKWDAPRLSHIDEISTLVDTLATGRYAMVCVRARLAGEPVPELRVPCFFNPQHGPSARDVTWTSPRIGTRRVPACTRCATQLAAREKPEVRTVQIGTRRVPYWEAGARFHPYSQGYFPSDAAAGGVAMAWIYTAPDLGSAPYMDHTGYGGDVGGIDFGGGGFDGGGGDGGGT
ncbi:hypothetical protein [Nocardioides sp. GXQ0305]|uniref:hypothetical protein n=1 Tax=Nocardioides sp. GXQ0305 TaxID=3423912 RepID=UPI003D7DFB0A